MSTFLWSGKDAEGHLRSERVEAENAQDAKDILVSAGWTDLELVMDEICYSRAIRVDCQTPEWIKQEGMEEDYRKELEKQDAPDRQAAHFAGKQPGLVAQWFTSILQAWWMILLSGVFLVFGLYQHRTFPVVFGAVLLFVLFLLHPLVLLFFKIFSRASEDYDRLNRAKVWGRWHEVLECVEQLRQPDRFTGAVVPAFELDRSQASALAALGRLDEGLAIFKKYENDPKVERWLYLSFLGTIYGSAQAFEKGLELRRQAAIEKPDSSLVWIDLAYACVRRLNYVVEAREALARAEQLVVPGLGQPYLIFLRGIISWREKKPAEAKDLLEKAIIAFKPWSHNPLTEGLILSTKAFLCAVNVDMGDFKAAKKMFSEVEPFLIVHHEAELLAACNVSAR
jgi:tetratricopeptide (TPR) repeat protein